MSELEMIKLQLDELKVITAISVKTALTINDAAFYLGMSSEYVRKMQKAKSIPSYRSKSGGVYFKKSDLDNWMLHTKVSSIDEIDAEAAKRAYLGK